MQHECDTSDTSAARVRNERHELIQVRHECYTNDTNVKRMKNFDFDNYTSKNTFSHPCIYYMANERLQGDKQLHSKNYPLEMPRSHTKMRLKSAPQKLNFLIAKDISKSYTLDIIVHVDALKCFCIVTHIIAGSFSIKTILCANTNTFLARAIESWVK